MPDEADPFELTVKIQRGTSTDDRDTLRCKVQARTVDQLEDRVEQLRERMEQWAEDLRDVQPTGETVRDHAVDEDQSTLAEGST